MRVKTFIKIFICFAPEDVKLYKGLEQQLQAASRHRSIELCSNEMSAGSDWKAEAESHLKTAHIILLLVSPDFMGSDYCYLVQAKLAMERHKRGDAIVIPIILSPTDWQGASFGKLKALPADAPSITTGLWRTQVEAFYDVTKGILEVVRTLDTKISAQKKRENISFPDGIYETTSSHAKRPLGMCLCPACIEEFYPNECDIVSELDGTVIESGKTGWLEKRIGPNPLTSPEYRKLQACRRCPHCGYLLPYNIERVDDNISIAIVGDTYSGKSMYLASLLYCMKERWMSNHTFTQMESLTRDVEQVFDHEYLIPLFGIKTTLDLTWGSVTTLVRPLIYELTFRAPSKNQEKKVNLIFYDSAGEDYVRQERMEQFARYVLRASAIIFLVDPCNITEMNSRLPNHLQPRISHHCPSYHLLTSTIELLEKYGPSVFRSAPLAVMLSKSDLLNYVYAPKVPRFKCLLPSPLHYDSVPSHDRLDLQDIKDVDAEVRMLIGETSEHPLLDIAQRFSKVSFFATSATGCAPDSSGYFSHISPCRCLDPLLWILHQRNIIPAKRNPKREAHRSL